MNTDNSTDCSSSNNAANSNTNTTVNPSRLHINLSNFCTTSVPDFTPLGGSRPDAAVVGCTAVWMEEEEEAEKDVILPPDVLDTALAMLCAPLIVRHAGDLRGREAHFQCHTATVRLQSTDEDAEEELRRITSDMPRGGLSVTLMLGAAVTELRDSFMSCWKNDQQWGALGHQTWEALGRVDLRRTSLRRMGRLSLTWNDNLTSVTFPPSLTEVGGEFLLRCNSLQCIDMGHTAVHTFGYGFAAHCPRLTTVTLPPSLTVVGGEFLSRCNSLQCIDMGHTALHTVGEGFAATCLRLTTVTFPPSLTVVGDEFLRRCYSLQCIDMGHTAVHTINRGFAYDCPRLTTVVLPDTVTEVGGWFLHQCGRVEVSSRSTAVQAAARNHNSKFDNE